MLKRVLIAIVLIVGIVVGIFMLPSGGGQVGFNGGTAFITATVVGTNGERIALEQQAPLTQSLVYEGIEIAYFEYTLEVEFDGDVDVQIEASKVSARLNCDVSCIVATEWGILPVKVQPGERHEIASVSISASTIENLAPSNTFQLKFDLNLQWRPLMGGSASKFLDVTYPIISLQKTSVDDPVIPPDDPDDPYIPPYTPPYCQCVVMLSVNLTPIVDER